MHSTHILISKLEERGHKKTTIKQIDLTEVKQEIHSGTKCYDARTRCWAIYGTCIYYFVRKSARFCLMKYDVLEKVEEEFIKIEDRND